MKNGDYLVIAISTIHYDFSLLSHWLDYYFRIGVDKCVINVNPDFGITLAEVKNSFSGVERIELFESSREERNYENRGKDLSKECLRKSIMGDNIWIVPADLDEFIQFHEPLDKIMERLQLCPKDMHMSGHLIDRISDNGYLNAVSDEISIWRQFPLQGYITKYFRGRIAHKVTLAHSHLTLGEGHHYAKSGRILNSEAKVHHFKWKQAVAKMLATRSLRYQKLGLEKMADLDHRVYSEIGETKKIDIHEKKYAIRPGWLPY